MRTEYAVEVYNKYHDNFVEQIDVFETYEEAQRYIKETDVIKKDSWTELAAYWSQYLKSISGIKYREKECNIYCQDLKGE